MLENHSSLPIITVYGATATGKSAFALRLAETINAEIISVDSAQVYRGMDVGTAKPNATDQQKIPHHLIDLVEPQQPYSVAKFIHDCQLSIKCIQAKNKAVILCGGTMLYFYRLFIGLSKLPKTNPELRTQLYQQWQLDRQKSHDRLHALDPVTAQKLHINDGQRIIRALEICLQEQTPMSQLQRHHPPIPIIKPHLNIILNIDDRTILHQNIQKRLDKMIEHGFIEEVQRLYNQPQLHDDLPSIRSVGYRQFWQYYANQLDYQNAYQNTLTATRRLAKRQITWIRTLENLPHTHVIHQPQRLKQALTLIREHGII